MIKARSLVGLLTLIVIMTISWFYFSYQQFLSAPIVKQQPLVFEVKAGSGANAVLSQLVSEELTSQEWFGRIFLKLHPELTQVKAGRYLLSPSMTIHDVFELLVSGKQIQYTFTIVEGLTFNQVVRMLLQHGEIDITDLKGLNDKQIFEALDLKYDHAEGALFADTYHFPAGYNAAELLRRSHQRLLAVLEEEWSERQSNLPYQTPYQALIMASIIEKETALESERATIAGVFVRRLQKKMRLQTDPTVIYGIGENFDGNITRKHLRTDTPYNTYTRRGLPPTPIAIVGREAIHAALNPEPGSALYFVAKGDGSHQFSDTLEEHNQAVKKYQLKQ